MYFITLIRTVSKFALIAILFVLISTSSLVAADSDDIVSEIIEETDTTYIEENSSDTTNNPVEEISEDSSDNQDGSDEIISKLEDEQTNKELIKSDDIDSYIEDVDLLKNVFYDDEEDSNTSDELITHSGTSSDATTLYETDESDYIQEFDHYHTGSDTGAIESYLEEGELLTGESAIQTGDNTDLFSGSDDTIETTILLTGDDVDAPDTYYETGDMIGTGFVTSTGSLQGSGTESALEGTGSSQDEIESSLESSTDTSDTPVTYIEDEDDKYTTGNQSGTGDHDGVLSGDNLSGSLLSGNDLSETLLSGSNLSGEYLSGENKSGTTISEIQESVDAQDALENESKNSLSHTGDEEIITAIEINDLDDETLFTGETLTEELTGSDLFADAWIYNLYLSGDNQDIQQFATGLQEGLEIKYPTTNLHIDSYGRFSVADLQGFDVINHSSSMTYCSYASFLNLDNLLRISHQEKEYTILRGDAIAIWNKTIGEGNEIFQAPRTDNEELINELYDRYESDHDTIFDIVVKNNTRSGEVMGYHRFTIVLGDDDQFYALDAIRMHRQTPLLLTKYIENHIRSSEDISIVMSYDIHDKTIQELEQSELPVVHTPLDFLPFVQNGEIIYSEEKQTITFFTGLIYSSEDSRLQVFIPNGLVISALSGETLKLSQFNLDPETKSGFMASFQFGIPDQHIIFSQPVSITQVLEGADDNLIDIRVQHAGEDRPGKIGLTTNSKASCNLDGSVGPADQLEGAVSLQDGIIKFYTCGASLFEFIEAELPQTYTLTINHNMVSGSLSDFPVYVNLSELWTGMTLEGAESIRIYDDADNELPREIVSKDELWFLAPSLSDQEDSNFTIDMDAIRSDYAADDEYGAYNVRRNDYVGRRHGSNFTDSVNGQTVSNNDGVVIESGTQIGKGFSHTNNAFGIPNPEDFVLTTFVTMSAWISTSSFNNGNIINVAGNNGYRFRVVSGNRIELLIRGGANNFSSSDNSVPSNTWTKIDITSDQNGTNIYINGQLDTSNNKSFAPGYTSAWMSIGSFNSSSEKYRGLIDEMHISHTSRSAAWIETEYNNQSNPASFYTLDKQEEAFDPMSIVLEVTTNAPNQSIAINKYFNVSNYTIERGDDTTSTANGNNIDHTYSTPGTYYVTLKNPGERWKFTSSNVPLVPQDGTIADSVKIAYMPSLADGFGNSASSPGNYFFYNFNNNGALESLPSGSFDTSNITSVGIGFFSNFNQNGSLTSLPEGSFDTNNITTVSSNFFSSFNTNGALESLPSGSFDTSNITSVGNNFFANFNNNGALTKLPDDSFNTSNITSVGIGFFSNFNNGGALTKSPRGVKIKNVTNSNIIFYYNDNGNQSETVSAGDYFEGYNIATDPLDIIIEVNVASANQTLRINKYFNVTDYTIHRGDGSTSIANGNNIDHTYATPGTYYVTLQNPEERWKFKTGNNPLVPKSGTTANSVKIVSMPSLADGFGESASSPGNYFFSSFNNNGALESLPSGSFDTSNITTVGSSFFYGFNQNGSLTSLPEGSFDTSNITTVGSNFFAYFNHSGALESLPEGSFDISGISGSVGDWFFYAFNYGGAINSLPEESFDISGISGSVGNSFFYGFNYNGALESLPSGSFDTSNITSVGIFFFYFFNRDGALESLPEGSFDTSNITSVGNSFFYGFNYNGALESLPSGSFDTSNITSVGIFFFYFFNRDGALESLPEGSFDTSNITSVGDGFFSYFNYSGALKSLPEGSFDTSNITTVGSSFFNQFNNGGALESLPEGSFDTSGISGSVGTYFFSYFNNNGALESLPEDSFDTSNITSVGSYFFLNFNNGGALTKAPRGVKIKNVTNGNVIFHYNDNGNKSESVSAGNYFDSYTMSGFMGFPPTIAGPASIDLGSISAQSNNQLLSGTSDYFIIDFVSSPYTGYYTTLEISDLVSTGSIIASGDIQVKANSLSLLSGDNNPAVSIDAGLLSFTNFGSGPLHFITKEAGDGAGIAGSYGSKLDIKIDLPAYQSVGKYTGTITYTLYEED